MKRASLDGCSRERRCDRSAPAVAGSSRDDVGGHPAADGGCSPSGRRGPGSDPGSCRSDRRSTRRSKPRIDLGERLRKVFPLFFDSRARASSLRIGHLCDGRASACPGVHAMQGRATTNAATAASTSSTVAMGMCASTSHPMDHDEEVAPWQDLAIHRRCSSASARGRSTPRTLIPLLRVAMVACFMERRFHRMLMGRRPRLVMIAGTSGVGKSTVGMGLAPSGRFRGSCPRIRFGDHACRHAEDEDHSALHRSSFSMGEVGDPVRDWLDASAAVRPKIDGARTIETEGTDLIPGGSPPASLVC